MAERRFCTVRFNLEKPEHQKAWERLQNIDRKQYKSYSAVIITALNKYFENSDTDLADTIVRRLLKALKKDNIGDISEQTEEIADDEKNIAWDYLGGKIKDIENK